MAATASDTTHAPPAPHMPDLESDIVTACDLWWEAMEEKKLHKPSVKARSWGLCLQITTALKKPIFDDQGNPGHCLTLIAEAAVCSKGFARTVR